MQSTVSESRAVEGSKRYRTEALVALVGIAFTSNTETVESSWPRGTEQHLIAIFCLPSGSSSKLACTRRTVRSGRSAPCWRSRAARARSPSATLARCPGRAGTGENQRLSGSVAPGLAVSRRVCDVVHSGEQMEFPMAALVTEEFSTGPSGEHQEAAQYIQGGALKTWIQLPGDPDACFEVQSANRRTENRHCTHGGEACL